MASRDEVSSLMESFAEGSAEFTIGRLSYVYGPIQKDERSLGNRRIK